MPFDEGFGSVPQVRVERTRRARTGTLVAVDAAVAVLAVALSWVVLGAGTPSWPDGSHAPDTTAYALVVLANAPLVLRRRVPLLALAAAVVAALAYLGRQYPPIFAPSVPLIVYTAATRLDDRRSWLVLVAAAIAAWLGATVAAGPTDPAAVFVVGGAWLLGHYVRTRRQLVGELRRRALDLEREREEQARRAVAEERLRIARELHDVLAHTMSVIAVQAGAGRLVGDDRPTEAVTALGAVEETARSAMQEMRQLLTVLRADDSPDASVSPTPGVEDLASLASEVTETGLPVELRVEGDTRSVSPGVGLSAYRIAQEALTNVIRHSGAARASVVVQYSDHDLVVEVRDDGRGSTAGPPSPGHGIIGMRERAAVHGGDLAAGPGPDGGFVVRVRLPLPAARR
jgi:signal transduction histidine kinase